MVANGTQRIQISGAGPYGFRLFGGDSEPLTVVKLRKQSKAFEAGLTEGDILVGINGVSCNSLSHAAAMSLLDRASTSLELQVFRVVGGDTSSLSTAYQDLGLRPLSPGSAAAPRRYVETIVAVQPVNHIDPSSSYSKEEHTSVEGNTTRHITTETKTADFGGHTVTKVTKQEMVQHGGQGYEPPQHQVFQVTAKVSPGGPKVWTPNRRSTDPIQSNEHPTNRKENQDPSSSSNQSKPVFRVSSNAPQRTPTKNKPWMWQPSFVPVIEREPENLDPEDTGTLQLPDEGEYAEKWKKTSEGSSADYQDDDLLPKHIRKVLTHVVENDPELRAYSKKKKKIFADSSFFDDPEHKYPTIEEQIKMARKVALSLTASSNVTARGQRMFNTRKQKANKWSTDYPGRELRDSDSESEVYYNPTPWKPGRPGKPGGNPHTMVASPLAAPPGPPSWMAKRFEPSGLPPPPAAPPFHPGSFLARQQPSTSFGSREERPQSSKPEFVHSEDIFAKIPHLPTAPQSSFSIADDLRQMKGKGGKLFAKRRARAVEESNLDDSRPPNYAVMQKIRSSYEPTKLQQPPPAPALKSKLDADVDSAVVAAASAHRLKELIEKTKMGSWDTSIDYGLSRHYSTLPSKRNHASGVTSGSVDDLGVRPSTGSKADFTSKSKGAYRPVKFRAPLDISAPSVSETSSSRRAWAPVNPSAQQPEGESEF